MTLDSNVITDINIQVCHNQIKLIIPTALTRLKPTLSRNFANIEDDKFFEVKPAGKIRFNAFNLFKEFPPKSQYYITYIIDDRGLGYTITSISNNKADANYSDRQELEQELIKMYLNLSTDITAETKRKYLRNPEKYLPIKRRNAYHRIFKKGVLLDTDHVHFRGGKNEKHMLISWIMTLQSSSQVS